MPMQWTNENQAKLFRIILQKANVKLSAEMREEIAAEMGEGCTPKAVSHQIAKLRSGETGATGGDSNTSSPKATKKRVSPSKTSTTKRGKTSTKAAAPTSDADTDTSVSPTKRIKTEGIKEESDKPYEF